MRLAAAAAAEVEGDSFVGLPLYVRKAEGGVGPFDASVVTPRDEDAVGFDAGVGLSSMISTQPGLSAPTLLSAICCAGDAVRWTNERSTAGARMDVLRTLGTRECSFCSRIFTRARISVTICTPFDLPVNEEVEEASVGRWVIVLTRGVLGAGRRDGEMVLVARMVDCVGVVAVGVGNPAR